MAKAQYVGVNGVARKVKQPYIGVSSVARKVKNGYVGVDGVARPFCGKAVLSSIEIVKHQSTIYGYIYQAFDTSFITVIAHYSDGTSKEIPSSNYSFSPSTFYSGGYVTVTISYTEDGVTAKNTVTVLVNTATDW